MTDLSRFAGVFPALYTCFEDNGDYSTARTRALAHMLCERGVQGLYVGGSSGECIYLSTQERMRLVEDVMQQVGDRLTVIAHVACNNTRDSMQLAAHAQACGVHAIAAIPPIYFHLPEHAIARYWNDISSAAPDTDFFIYNIPQLAGVALTTPLLREMRKNPRVVGVKNSSMPTQDIQTFKGDAACGQGLIVFNGPDEQFVSGLAMGADGGIGGTYGAMPEMFLAMYALCRAGRYERARLIQYEVNDIISALCGMHGNMYAAIKRVIERRLGMPMGSVRAPLAPLSDADDALVCACCDRIGDAISRLPR